MSIRFVIGKNSFFGVGWVWVDPEFETISDSVPLLDLARMC